MVQRVREFWRLYELEIRLVGGVIAVGWGAWQFASNFQTPTIWSWALAVGVMWIAVTLLWPLYTRIKYLETQADIRSRLDGLMNGVGMWIVDGQRLQGWVQGIPDPSPQHQDWINQSEAWISGNLGLHRVAQVRNSAGLTLDPALHMEGLTELQQFVLADSDYRLQRLNEILKELREESTQIKRVMVRR